MNNKRSFGFMLGVWAFIIAYATVIYNVWDYQVGLGKTLLVMWAINTAFVLIKRDRS
jgi:hypothetical protein